MGQVSRFHVEVDLSCEPLFADFAEEGLRLLVDAAMLQERSEKASAAKESSCSFWPRCVSKAFDSLARTPSGLPVAVYLRYAFGSTRKITKIVEELCGHSVSSTQVSAAAKLDAELQSWRDRPLGSCSYMILDIALNSSESRFKHKPHKARRLLANRACSTRGAVSRLCQ